MLEKPPIRIAIVEDDSGFRETLELVLGRDPGFAVAASCPNAESALKNIPGTGCDLVIMDINLPGLSGIDCLKALKERESSLRVIMLTAFDDDRNLFDALAAGADGYLLKRSEKDRLLEAIRGIAQGGHPISSNIARRMMQFFQDEALGSPKTNQELNCLTHREHEVLELLANGFTPKEISGDLGISWQTVRNFIKSIYEKLHVHNRTDAILKYHRKL